MRNSVFWFAFAAEARAATLYAFDLVSWQGAVAVAIMPLTAALLITVARCGL